MWLNFRQNVPLLEKFFIVKNSLQKASMPYVLTCEYQFAYSWEGLQMHLVVNFSDLKRCFSLLKFTQITQLEWFIGVHCSRNWQLLKSNNFVHV